MHKQTRILLYTNQNGNMASHVRRRESMLGLKTKKGSPARSEWNSGFAIETKRSMAVFSLPTTLNYYLSCIVA
jgi:hypothetical protein